MIQAITFDFWCTLYHYRESPELRRVRYLRKMLHSAGYTEIPDTRILMALHKAWGTWDRVWRGEQRTFGAERWLDLFLGDLGITLPEVQLVRTIKELEELVACIALPVQGVVDLLHRLSANYRLGVISDTSMIPGRGLRDLLSRDRLLSCFTVLTFSDEFGRSKPHPSPFLVTLSRLRVEPHHAVHVGDLRQTDVQGARTVGMRTIRYAGVRDDDLFLLPDADAVIYDYSELEPLLETWDNGGRVRESGT